VRAPIPPDLERKKRFIPVPTQQCCCFQCGEFDENVRLGKRAVREFGLEGSVEKLEAALGSADLLKLTAKLGRGLKEDSFA
jgi:hypothetical protein